MRTIQLQDGTVIVVRQIAAVGPIVHREKFIDEDDDADGPLPKKHWCTFDIVLVGGTKLYPQLEYSDIRTGAENDRTMVLAEIYGAQGL